MVGSAQVVVNKVVLTTPDDGPTRTYRATAYDTQGRPVQGAVLDIAGLSDDPDVRVATTPMTAISATSSQATLNYPAPGAWIVVVRVHAPSQYVHLGNENITGVAESVAAHNTPSRQALEAISPNLGARLTAAQNGTPVALTAGHATEVAIASGHDLNSATGLATLAEDVGFSVLHLLGVCAWLVAIGSVALAGRAGKSVFGQRLLVWVSPRYSMLAGGGLVLVTITGISNLRRSGPDALFDGTITSSNVGRLYVGALALKMGLVAASQLTSFRLGQQLARMGRPGLGQVGATVLAGSQGGTVGFVGTVDATMTRLALRNVAFAAVIVGCVNVMNQASHLLH